MEVTEPRGSEKDRGATTAEFYYDLLSLASFCSAGLLLRHGFVIVRLMADLPCTEHDLDPEATTFAGHINFTGTALSF